MIFLLTRNRVSDQWNKIRQHTTEPQRWTRRCPRRSPAPLLQSHQLSSRPGLLSRLPSKFNFRAQIVLQGSRKVLLSGFFPLRGEVALFDMPNLNRFDISLILIFCKIALSIQISIFSKITISISISIFSKITLSISISISIFLESIFSTSPY